MPEGLLSRRLLRGALRQEGHALQLGRAARALPHARVLHAAGTASHVRVGPPGGRGGRLPPLGRREDEAATGNVDGFALKAVVFFEPGACATTATRATGTLVLWSTPA